MGALDVAAQALLNAAGVSNGPGPKRPMRMSVSADALSALAADHGFRFEPRGAVALKGKGEMSLAFVERAS